jgi:hypothetical protein
MWVGGQRHDTADLFPGKLNWHRCTQDWAGLGACLDGYGKYRPLPRENLKKIKQKFLKQHHQHVFLKFTEHSGPHT